MGDPSKLVLLDPVLRTIKNDNLIERTKTAGDALVSGLINLQVIENFFSRCYLFSLILTNIGETRLRRTENLFVNETF